MTFPIDGAMRPRRPWVSLAIAVAVLTPTPWVAAADASGSPAAPRPWTWSVVYKADVLAASAPRAFASMDNLNAQVDVDGAALLGWDDTAIHGELLANHGSKLNRRVGTTQGISNIEVVQNSVRLYATWIEHQLKATKTRVLVGLYDLNSEFYATDASGMLIHPSFGIGIDFSQSGRNGPSIFPNLGLGVRVRQPIGQGGYLQVAAIDGVPGDPDHPGRTAVRLGRSDGALLVGEAGWQQPGESGPGPGHWGIGIWQYTRASDRADDAPAQRNQGVYAVAQSLLGGSGAGRTTGFVRAGAANRRVNGVDLAMDAGMLIATPFGARGPRAMTAGVAIARFSSSSSAPVRTRLRSEVALEVDARWQSFPNVALQPLLQWVLHPGGRSGSAAIAGLRMEWVLEPK
jgi:porin